MRKSTLVHYCFGICFNADTKDSQNLKTKKRIIESLIPKGHKKGHSCPICSAIESFFDLQNPESHHLGCKSCHEVDSLIREKFGSLQGFVMISHFSPLPISLLKEKIQQYNVKKIIILYKTQDKIKEKEIAAQELTPELEENVLYTVAKYAKNRK